MRGYSIKGCGLRKQADELHREYHCTKELAGRACTSGELVQSPDDKRALTDSLQGRSAARTQRAGPSNDDRDQPHGQSGVRPLSERRPSVLIADPPPEREDAGGRRRRVTIRGRQRHAGDSNHPRRQPKTAPPQTRQSVSEAPRCDGLSGGDDIRADSGYERAFACPHAEQQEQHDWLCRSGFTFSRYLGSVTTEDQWIGDLGHLALADATLGALLIDMLIVLAHAEYPESPPTVDPGLTTKQAAGDARRRLEAEPELFGGTAGDWLSDVVAVTDSRNELLHAVALDRCGVCGASTRFVHPRSGQEVDRSEKVVRDLTARALALHKDGMLVAEQTAERVNALIVARARLDAEATGEIQNPPQVYPHHVTHKCGNCTGNGRGSTTIRLGTAVAVYPREQLKAVMEGLRKPPRRSNESRAVRRQAKP